jgi:hypothetical protein
MPDEILERLVRIETKLDFYKAQIDEVKESQKWFRRTTSGALVTAVFSLVVGTFF